MAALCVSKDAASCRLLLITRRKELMATLQLIPGLETPAWVGDAAILHMICRT